MEVLKVTPKLPIQCSNCKKLRSTFVRIKKSNSYSSEDLIVCIHCAEDLTCMLNDLLEGKS